MTADLLTIAGYALREGVRRRALLVVCVLSVGFLALYAWGTEEAFEAATDAGGVLPLDEQVLVGATLLGLAVFVALFLGAVLAVFLTLSAVRGDAERGLLQPLVVRPIGRTTLLLGRFVAAAAICVPYVLLLFGGAVLITGLIGGFWPPRGVTSGLALAGAVVVLVALALLGATVLTTTANGIAVFMVYGAGLAAGLLGEIGEALSSQTIEQIAKVTSWLVPFEAL